jgi:hypothetical protein
VLLAIASRETGCRDSPARAGTGAASFPIDDRSFGQRLAAHGAGGPGGLPPLRDAAKLAARLVLDNMEFAAAGECARQTC